MQSSSLLNSVFVNVIIVTYNGAKWIEKCLESILCENEDGVFEIEIIVIDNNSQDETRDIVKRFSSVKLIHSNENLGFGKANNIGLQKALENRLCLSF